MFVHPVSLRLLIFQNLAKKSVINFLFDDFSANLFKMKNVSSAICLSKNKNKQSFWGAGRGEKENVKENLTGEFLSFRKSFRSLLDWKGDFVNGLNTTVGKAVE